MSGGKGFARWVTMCFFNELNLPEICHEKKVGEEERLEVIIIIAVCVYLSEHSLAVPKQS